MTQLFLALHVFANTVWIGSIAAVGFLTAASSRTEITERRDAIAQVALQLYRRSCVPAFVLSLSFGLARLLHAPSAYLHLHWFHAKLTAALVVIALHHVLGSKARKAAAGSRHAGTTSVTLTVTTLAFAFVTVVFAVLKGPLTP
ncbi:MAG: CopD family protein [Polyangiaceae bacterium]|nr:CopD family protein [Polyangiaceae bacterium]